MGMGAKWVGRKRWLSRRRLSVTDIILFSVY